MVTTKSDMLQALRAQRTLQLAEDPVDRVAVRMINRTIRALRGSDETPEEKAQELQDAFVEVRDMEATPASFEQEQWTESATLLMQNVSTLPEDDADPTVLDQTKIRGALRRTVLNADAAFDPIRSQAAEWLERFFGVFLDERPAEAVLAPLVTGLSTLQSVETLAATLAAAESNADRLRGA